VYQFVKHQLITGFECQEINEQLYCPCETGLTDAYPAFIFMLNSLSL
jgi:hypothetical protein